MRFEDEAFLLGFLPVFLTAYFVAAAAPPGRVPVVRAALPHLVLAAASLAFLWSLVTTRGVGGALAVAVVACLAISYVVDRRRGDAPRARTLTGALYLVQFPILLGGPLIRYRDFQAQIARRLLSLGAFTYGVRRFAIGFIKVVLVAAPLGRPVDRIFSLPASLLSADAAWFGAACFGLQLYFQFSGYADMAIGLGRMIGLRYPENFRRPYTADSLREFWRRWNITLVTWLRDYAGFPIAGRDAPTAGLTLTLVAGFCLIGLWHRPGWMALAWGVYAGLWLAIETIWMGSRVARWPAPLRHAYVLLIALVGWAILRSGTPAGAWIVLKAMAGWPALFVLTAHRFVTMDVGMALVAGVLFAGPLVPSISRWRVSLDAAAVSVLLMGAATGVFLWRSGAQLAGAIRPRRSSVP